MGTRGAFGFRLDGRDKITYNHWDSYPSGLGADVVRFTTMAFRPRRLQKTIDAIANLRLVSTHPGDDTPMSVPSADDIARLEQYADWGVGDQHGRSNPSWYKLLRRTQGDLAAILDAGVMIDNRLAMLGCSGIEYAYIINVDDMTVEFYDSCLGHRSRERRGRYASMTSDKLKPDEHDPMDMVGALPIADIDSWRNTWGRDLFPMDDE